MSYQISISENKKNIIVAVNEDMTRSLAVNIGNEINAKSEELNIYSFLFDLRNSQNKESAIANYDYAYKAEDDKILIKNATVALLVKEGDKSHDFLQMFMHNAGYNVRIFSDEESAVSWLNEEF